MLSSSGPLANTLGKLNPFRYRGYVYDDESGLYYLNSRYYRPAWSRFINADEILGANGDILSNNLFAYCSNEPINNFDPSGQGIFSGLKTRATTMMDNPNWYTVGNWLSLGFFDTVKGAVQPEKPLSLQHWLDSADVALTVVSWGSAADAARKAIASTPTDPIQKALKELGTSGIRPGQTDISRSQLQKIMSNFDPNMVESWIYIDGNVRYLVEGHHTTVACRIIGRGSSINMNIPTKLLPSATNVYWSKKWYEFGKTVIKVVD